MTIHENDKDRGLQQIAASRLSNHIRWMGGNVRMQETPEHRRECYDFEIHDGHGMWTGVLEVKSRRVSSDDVEKWGSLIVEVERLASLRALFYLPTLDEASGKRKWTKDVIFLFYCVNDSACYAINIEEIIAHWDTLEDAPEKMMTDNHGEVQADKHGKLIPLDIMVRFT